MAKFNDNPSNLGQIVMLFKKTVYGLQGYLEPLSIESQRKAHIWFMFEKTINSDQVEIKELNRQEILRTKPHPLAKRAMSSCAID